jgi:hypothetical protein
MPSALSFHCMICFEEFDSHTLYPVVLPCGHTYICVQCASKIDKCMECRQSLLAEDDNIITKNSNRDAYYDQRHPRTYTSTVTRAQLSRRPSYPPLTVKGSSNKNKKRLPLPKNIVLLSLIESSQLASESFNDASITNDPSMVPDYETEEERIVMSTDLATSSCGTYAVAKKEGLDIVATMDERLLNPVPFEKQSFLGRMRSSPPIFQTKNAPAIHLNYGDR